MKGKNIMNSDIKSAEDRLGIGFVNEVEKYDYAQDSLAVRIVGVVGTTILVAICLSIMVVLH